MDSRDSQHLSRASALLHHSSPSISRHLSTTLHARQYYTSTGASNHGPTYAACQVCGTIKVPGRTAEVRRGRQHCVICKRTEKVGGGVKKPSRGAMLAQQRARITLQARQEGQIKVLDREPRNTKIAVPDNSRMKTVSTTIHMDSGISSRPSVSLSTLKTVPAVVLQGVDRETPGTKKPKNKSKNKGLAALLAKKEQEKQKKQASGLDLSDFMI